MMRRPSAWQLCQLPKLAIGLVFAVDVSALTPLYCLSSVPSAADLTLALFIATLSIAYSSLTCSLERARTALQASAEPASYRNLLASWTFVGAVILPAPLIVGVVAVSAVAEWPVRKLAGQARLYRHVYSMASVVPAALMGRVIASLSLPLDLMLPLAAVVYVMVNSSLVAAAMIAVRQADSARAFLRRSAYKIEVATLAVALAEVELFRHGQVPMMWLSSAGHHRHSATRRAYRAAGGLRAERTTDERGSMAHRRNRDNRRVARRRYPPGQRSVNRGCR